MPAAEQRQPWSAESDIGWFLVLDADRRLVARTTTEKNARLLAAAPQLLEACAAAFEWYEARVGRVDAPEFVDLLGRAITKARLGYVPGDRAAVVDAAQAP